MVKISLVVLRDSIGSGVFPAFEMFRHADQYMIGTTGEKTFEIKLVGYKSLDVDLDGAATVHCDTLISDSPQQDVVIISPPHLPFTGEFDLSYYDDLCSWLRSEHAKGTKVGSMCMGSLLLAQAGLLDGQSCTTHWLGVDLMKKEFPKVCIEPSRPVSIKNNVYTSGGAFTSMQLVLHIIEEYCGIEVAKFMAKMTAIEYPLQSQNQFYVLNGQKGHKDLEILDVQEYMEQNFDQALKLADLSARANMTSRTFIRRFKKATGETPLKYLQKVRIEAAKKALESGKDTVSDIMYDSGYQDPKSFAILFKRQTGLTPVAYYKKHLPLAS